MTLSDIRAHLDNEHFFSRATMRFFGDTMRSFGLRRIGSDLIMYRKPSAMVNVFGRSCRAGREFFSAWQVIEHPDGSVSIDRLDREHTEEVYRAVAG